MAYFDQLAIGDDSSPKFVPDSLVSVEASKVHMHDTIKSTE